MCAFAGLCWVCAPSARACLVGPQLSEVSTESHHLARAAALQSIVD